MWIKNPTRANITLHSSDGDTIIIPAGISESILDKFASAVPGSGLVVTSAPSSTPVAAGPDPTASVTYGLLPQAITKFLMDNPAIIAEALGNLTGPQLTALITELSIASASSNFADILKTTIIALPTSPTAGVVTLWSDGGIPVVSQG